MRPLLCLLLLSACALSQAETCRKIEVTGLKPQAAKNVERGLYALGYLLCDANISPQQQRHTVQKVIQDAIKPFGFFSPTLKWEQANSEETWQVHVTPGPPMHVHHLTLKITTPLEGYDNATLLKQMHLHPGMRLNTQNYQNNLHFMRDLAHQLGYLNANTTDSHLVIDPKHQHASIHLVLNPGPRFHIGRITIHASPFKQDFIQRFLKARQGDPFRSRVLEHDQRKLNMSGYFKSVAIERGKTHDYTTPLTYQLQPRKPRYYLLGFGYDTDVGLQGLGGIKWRYINHFGHQLSISGRLGNNRSEFDTIYTIPLQDPIRDKLTFQATLQTDLDQDFADSRFIDLSAHFRRRAKRHNLHIGMIYKREHSFPYGREDYVSNLIYPELEWRYHLEGQDHLLVLRSRIKGSHRHLLSDLSFAQWQTQANYRLGTTRPWQLVLRGTLGFTHIKNLNDLPSSLQFATGGAQSVRGYAYQSIGPGRVLKIASVGVNRQIIPNLFATLFLDAGNASEHLRDPWKKSAGVGIVWSLPVGQCVLSVARPIQAQNHHWRLHLSFTL